jgi:hypothetical protein
MLKKKNIATYVGSISNFQGDARLFKVSPPVVYENWSYNDQADYKPKEMKSDYVVVSAIGDMFGGETFIFPADENGNVISWGELQGSQRGNVSHEDVLLAAGYRVKQ